MPMVEQNANYWREFASMFGWQLIGFTFRQHALFDTNTYQTLNLNRSQAEDIKKAIKRASYNPSLDEALNSGDGTYRP